MTFRSDFEWQDRFFEIIKATIGPLNVERAPRDADVREATDMLMLIQRDMHVGCRIRRPGYAERYPWDFTVRSRRDSGAETEFEKIVMKGFCDRLFYAHAAQPQPGPLARWLYIHVPHLRGHLASPKHRAVMRWGERSNGDGTHFYWFDVRSFLPDPPVVIAQSHQWTTLEPVAVPPTISHRVAAKQDSPGPLFDWR